MVVLVANVCSNAEGDYLVGELVIKQKVWSVCSDSGDSGSLGRGVVMKE